MARAETRMTHAPMLDDILGQGDSLRGLLAYHSSDGLLALEAIGQALRRCTGRILISGMGASFFAALPAAQALETQGHHVLFAEASELLHYGGGGTGSEGSWRAGDLALLISRSGGSIETLELARRLTAAGVPFVAVTNVPGSPLTRAAQHTLHIHSQPDQLIAVQTYTGTLLALLLAAEQAAALPTPTLADQTLAALPALEQHIARSLDQSGHWQQFFLGAGPLYLLGRGGALATLNEGALLLHETAKVPAVAMSSGQFRHGPVEVVSPDFRAIIVGTPAPTRSLDWQLALDLRAMRADVCWLGPAIPGDTRPMPSLVPWPADIPPALSPLFDIVPLQAAAFQTALWRNIRPGDFRYASEITDKETGFPLFEASVR